MIKIINEVGKEVFTGVTTETPFDSSDFHEVDTSWSYADYQWALHTNIGSITVLDRLTGYLGDIQDIETGFRDIDGKFWVASGGFDVRDSGVKTIGEAIQWIKDNSDTCTGE